MAGRVRWLERRGVGDVGELRAERRLRDGAGSAPAIRGPFFAASMIATRHCGH
jgi:hypothetical protein